ncbi:hypothetical protein GUITHDRAFT_156200 [Guillardia theta CCMP2712]|uniref:Uncharacterized protein n=1 Tax=Guillardia theta (strain CCMP2712) TaxID=905079 RepID=L1IAQ3_GUITC|nr:hypothetical protein GUITHDRAFT_156200 [Guillardia theta CCMP2712]EKX32925.1 hypothetical protein GUITHDRAFT_156200 [Guillardia theta CCMP2712]|eukprot:XP_005819905.1 hypothetical protein GUITHDRAFT_156200 [Guillardia theta CCMP2712]
MSFQHSLSTSYTKARRWGDLASHDDFGLNGLKSFNEFKKKSPCWSSSAAVYKGTNNRMLKSNTRTKEERRSKMDSRRSENNHNSGTRQSMSAGLDFTERLPHQTGYFKFDINCCSSGPLSGLVITGARRQGPVKPSTAPHTYTESSSQPKYFCKL